MLDEINSEKSQELISIISQEEINQDCLCIFIESINHQFGAQISYSQPFESFSTSFQWSTMSIQMDQPDDEIWTNTIKMMEYATLFHVTTYFNRHQRGINFKRLKKINFYFQMWREAKKNHESDFFKK